MAHTAILRLFHCWLAPVLWFSRIILAYCIHMVHTTVAARIWNMVHIWGLARIGAAIRAYTLARIPYAILAGFMANANDVILALAPVRTASLGSGHLLWLAQFL